MAEFDRITIDSKIGHPCIRNMRISVETVLNLLALGTSSEKILHDYPNLDADDIKATLEYAAQHIWLIE